MVTKEQLRELGWSESLIDRVYKAVEASAEGLEESRVAAELSTEPSTAVMSDRVDAPGGPVVTGSQFCLDRA